MQIAVVAPAARLRRATTSPLIDARQSIFQLKDGWGPAGQCGRNVRQDAWPTPARITKETKMSAITRTLQYRSSRWNRSKTGGESSTADQVAGMASAPLSLTVATETDVPTGAA